MKQIKFLMVPALILFIVGCGNKGPAVPERPIGPSVVIPNIPDTFACVTTDPEGDNIKYRFDWGDGIISDWGVTMPSGDTYRTAHTYTSKGYYYVKCQAKDERGKTSGWSEDNVIVAGLGVIRWFFTCPDYGDFNSTPAIDNQGNIYCGCNAGHLHSVNYNGQERQGWPYTSATEDEFVSSPAIASDGTIYACDLGGRVYALNSNGTLKWSYLTTDEIIATPAVGRNNEVYVNSTDGNLYAISSSGQLMWTRQVGGYGSVAIDGSNHLYVGSEDGYFYSYDTAGNLRWAYNTGDEIISSPAIMPDGKICFGGYDGYFYIFNPDSTLFHQEDLTVSISASPVIGTDSAIYITSEEGHLIRLKPNGTFDWVFATDGYYCSSPAVVRYPGLNSDIIYFKASWAKKKQDEDSLYMINADGTRFAASALPQAYIDEIVSSPTVNSSGTIFTGGGIDDDDHGGLFALSGRGILANTTWPLFRRDNKNTGRVQ